MIRYGLKGLRELDRALGAADKNLRRGLRDRFRDIAADVAIDARSIAESKGLRKSGDLIASIKPFASGKAVGVRATATHGGYRYPRRLEYEHRGRRGFLNPAVKQNEAVIERGLQTVLDRIEDDWRGIR